MPSRDFVHLSGTVIVRNRLAGLLLIVALPMYALASTTCMARCSVPEVAHPAQQAHHHHHTSGVHSHVHGHGRCHDGTFQKCDLGSLASGNAHRSCEQALAKPESLWRGTQMSLLFPTETATGDPIGTTDFACSAFFKPALTVSLLTDSAPLRI